MKLQPFVTKNPPRQDNVVATEAQLARFRGRLPEALLELWQKHGFGFYGENLLCLIDPEAWQAVLDRWMVAGSKTVRTPILLTPFGGLVYHRQLTSEDEDIVLLKPEAKTSEVLIWSLTDFFNGFLCDQASVRDLMPMDGIDLAKLQASSGTLEAGEVYQIDAVLLPVQVFKVDRVDALQMHRQLRDAVDAGASGDEENKAPENLTLQTLLNKSGDVDIDREESVGIPEVGNAPVSRHPDAGDIQ
jgi:hypothetical protein